MTGICLRLLGWVLLLLAACVLLGTLDTAPIAATDPPRFILMHTCRLNAADHELETGWFACGVAAAFAVQAKPGSAQWQQLKTLRGQRGRIVFEVLPEDAP